MKKINYSFYSILILLCVLFLNSCTSTVEIAKKRYRPGYYIAISNTKDNESKNSSINTLTTSHKLSHINKINGQLSAESSLTKKELNSDYNFSASISPIITYSKPFILDEKIVSKSEIKKEDKKVSIQRSSSIPKSKKLYDELPIEVLYLLCIFIPPVAVGFATDWDMNKLIINLVLTILCGIPGIIHAFLVVAGKI